MLMSPLPAAEVFSVLEIARAAGVSLADARHGIGSAGTSENQGFFRATEAVRFVRMLRQQPVFASPRDLFAPPTPADRAPGRGLAASGALHGAAFAVILLTLGFSSAVTVPQRTEPARLVFLAIPGPGGGGGGGGLRQPAPPRKAQLKGASALESPVPPPRVLSAREREPEVRRPVPPPVRPVRPPVEPPPPSKPVVTPQVVAPVATASSDARDRAGVLSETNAEAEGQGSGSGSGVGTGRGSGVGEGAGAGIGPGSGGGTGGGPYRRGAGITPPSLIREIRPDYTEEARRLGLEGDVVLEVIVRSDGSVSDLKVLKALGGGLDRRAIDAVRQWRFSPARRQGTPVDVMVEVAVEFKLR